MGIVNATPDSFSDGGKHIEADEFIGHCQGLIKNGASILDIGAESTAPLSLEVSSDIELQRFEKTLFMWVDKEALFPDILTIDTYKYQTFKKVYQRLERSHFKGRIFWNDVSGKLDHDFELFEKEMPSQVGYIYCHNLAPTRRDSQKHHLHILPDEIFFDQFINYFKQAQQFLKESKRDIWWDPCFGFSKNTDQNKILLDRFDEFINELGDQSKIVVGISKKRFLKEEGERLDDPADLLKIETRHQQALVSLLKKNPMADFVFRVHDPEILYLLDWNKHSS